MGFSSGRFSTTAGIMFLLSLVLGVLLGGCAAEPISYERQVTVRTKDQRPEHPGARIAITQLGAPYRYGGASPRGFDCSGLVYYAYRQAGIRVPRTTRAQLRNAVQVPRSGMQPGDLVFFKLDRRPVSHVGIYTGNNRFVHAPSSGKQVTLATMNDPYWQARFVIAGRYF